MITLRTRFLALAFTLVGGLGASAQTGPYSHDELFVLTTPPGQSLHTLYRINPATGVGVPFVDSILPSYSDGDWIDFDAYRDAMVGFFAWEPLGVFQPRLFAISEDGELTDLGFNSQTDKITGIAPTGDGRIYLQKKASGLHVLDAFNVLHPVLDHNGVQFDLLFDQVHYDAASNSLIGASAFTQPASPCFEAGHFVVHRLPLTPNGLAMSGPISCNKYDVNAGAWVMGLDPFPNGDLLLTLAGSSNITDDLMYRVSLPSLAISLWSATSLYALDGGVWNDTLARAILLDDISNELRTFSAGQTGPGVTLPVNVPVGDGTTGNSARNSMVDIEVSSAACTGSVIAFGERLEGTGGVEPKLGVVGCPVIAGSITFVVADALGQAGGILAMSAGTAPFPLVGGTFYVLPPFLVQLPLVTGGTQGVAGDGAALLPLPTPANGNLVGVPFYAQAGIADAGAVSGFSLTNAVKFTLGN